MLVSNKETDIPALSVYLTDENIRGYKSSLMSDRGYPNPVMFLTTDGRVTSKYIPFVSYGIHRLAAESSHLLTDDEVRSAIESAYKDYIILIVSGGWMGYIEREESYFIELGYCTTYKDLPYPRGSEPWILAVIKQVQYRDWFGQVYEIPEYVKRDFERVLDESTAKLLIESGEVSCGSLAKLFSKGFIERFAEDMRVRETDVYIDEESWLKLIGEEKRTDGYYHHMPNEQLVIQSKGNDYIYPYRLERLLKQGVLLGYI